MTPFATDLMRHSTPATPTAHERHALRARRQIRRTACSTFIKKILGRALSILAVAKRPRVNARS